jgi:hypothetical protein
MTRRNTAYSWCKKKPERFELLRGCLLNGGDRSFPLYVAQEAQVLFKGDDDRLLMTPQDFDRALFYSAFISWGGSCYAVIRSPWRKKTFDALRGRLQESENLRHIYRYAEHYLDLAESGISVEELEERAARYCPDGTFPYRYWEFMYWLLGRYAGKEITDEHTHYKVRALVPYFTPSSLRRVKDLDKAVDAVRDTPVPDNRFSSLKEAVRAHDKWAEEDLKRRLEEDKNLTVPFKYREELLDIVQRHGWRLPETPFAMLVRGREHRNCVASYASTQGAAFLDGLFHLVLFTEDKSAELVFSLHKGRIEAGKAAQCKGKFNRNLPADGLQDILEELTGREEDIVKVM